MQLQISTPSAKACLFMISIYVLLFISWVYAQEAISPLAMKTMPPYPRGNEGTAKNIESQVSQELADSESWIVSAYGEHYFSDDSYRDFNFSGAEVEFERRIREVKWLDRLSLGSSIGFHHAYGESQYWLDTNVYKADANAPSLSVLGRVYILDFKKFGWFAEASVGGIWFDESFPPNGSQLNYLIRYGTGVRVNVVENWDVLAGFRHVQISNGKGYSSSNPVFEGNGFFLGAGYKF